MCFHDLLSYTHRRDPHLKPPVIQVCKWAFCFQRLLVLIGQTDLTLLISSMWKLKEEVVRACAQRPSYWWEVGVVREGCAFESDLWQNGEMLRKRPITTHTNVSVKQKQNESTASCVKLLKFRNDTDKPDMLITNTNHKPPRAQGATNDSFHCRLICWCYSIDSFI